MTAIAVYFVSSSPIVLKSSNRFFSSTAAFTLHGTGKISGAAVTAIVTPMAIMYGASSCHTADVGLLRR